MLKSAQIFNESLHSRHAKNTHETAFQTPFARFAETIQYSELSELLYDVQMSTKSEEKTDRESRCLIELLPLQGAYMAAYHPRGHKGFDQRARW